MTEHDPLCPDSGRHLPQWCQCDLIARVRADERSKSDMGLLGNNIDLRAEVERLQRLVAVLEKMLDTEAMVLADLRTKVDGLPVRLTDDGVGTSLYVYVKRADVLALLDEEEVPHG